MYLGIDTSCYTTSVAAIDRNGIIFDKRIVLEVPHGKRGLRQSDAVFLHTRNLAKIFDEVDISNCECVSVSSRPRNIDGSYMPVFLSGVCAAKAVHSSIKCQYNEFSHQQGHIMAGLYSAGVLHWRNSPFLAFHISGGTTEMLLVNGDEIKIVGKTLDISAGQLIDRIGVKLGLSFPCGQQLEVLAQNKTNEIKLPVSVNGLDINFSGAETKALRYDDSPENLAGAVIDCVAETAKKVTENAQSKYNIENILLVGGVAANKQLRYVLRSNVKFASPKFSTDNSIGIALLGGIV